jgi:hypothetical protein
VRRPEEQHAPERQVEPAKVLGMADVLQIVKHRDLRASRKQRRGETRVQHHVQLEPRGSHRQRQLLPQNAEGTRSRADGLRQGLKVRPRWRELRPGFAVGEDEIFVDCVDLGQRGEQAAQIYLGATHAAGDKVESVDADAQRTGHLFGEPARI